jgi:hypothetical protein
MTECTQEIGYLESMYISGAASASQAELFLSFSSLCLGGSNCAYVANPGVGGDWRLFDQRPNKVFYGRIATPMQSASLSLYAYI